MPDDQNNSRKRSFPLLIVEDDPDHQLIIQYSLLNSMPQAEAMFASTAEEALGYLQIAQIAKRSFPCVLVLDIGLPDPFTGLALIKEIRIKYPLLPIIILSGAQDEWIIRQAYEAGASSFLCKPASLESWQLCFLVFSMYWSEIVTLPRPY